MAWSESGQLLAFLNRHRQAEILNLADGQSLNLGDATAVTFYPDGSHATVMGDKSVAVWQVNPLKCLRQAEFALEVKAGTKFSSVVTLGYSPDGRWLACGTDTFGIMILDAEDLRVVHVFDGHDMNVITDLEWLAPTTLATSATDNTIRFWSISQDRIRQLRVLEAESFVLGISYSPALDCLVAWTTRKYLAWSVSTGEIWSQEGLPFEPDIESRYVSASPRRDLIAKVTGPGEGDIAISRGWGGGRDKPPGSVSTYANAKVLMLGDSGVGKSGLAMVLAREPFEPTESTHARRIWKMPAPGLAGDTGAQREVLLWDLAGQPGYRIVHQLHLSDGAVALIVFDSRSETAPLAGVGYWARALRHAQAARSDALPTFMVGARTDRGVVGVSDERVAEIVTEFGFRDYLTTSAKEGWGIGELRTAVLDAIDWDRIPMVTSSALFAAAKSFVLGQKAEGTILTPLASLLAAFLGAPVTGPAAEAAPGATVGRDLLDSEPGERSGAAARRVRGVRGAAGIRGAGEAPRVR
jgi:GTPase SAR1 family protein